jgi:hypothetical protein
MLRYVELLSEARTPLADFFSILLDCLLARKDKYMKREIIIAILTHLLLRFQLREPLDEAIGKRFRYRGEDHTVGAG